MATKTVICRKCKEVIMTETWGGHKKDFTVKGVHELDCNWDYLKNSPDKVNFIGV